MDALGDYASVAEFILSTGIDDTHYELEHILCEFNGEVQKLSGKLPCEYERIIEFKFLTTALRGGFYAIKEYIDSVRSGQRKTRTSPLLDNIAPALADSLYQRGELKRYWDKHVQFEERVVAKLEEKVGLKRKHADTLRRHLEERFGKKISEAVKTDRETPAEAPHDPPHGRTPE